MHVYSIHDYDIMIVKNGRWNVLKKGRPLCSSIKLVNFTLTNRAALTTAINAPLDAEEKYYK